VLRCLATHRIDAIKNLHTAKLASSPSIGESLNIIIFHWCIAELRSIVEGHTKKECKFG
jgi:hypothetical protein